MSALIEFVRWLVSSWWELLTRNLELLRARDRLTWIGENIEAVTILVVTIATLILIISILLEPELFFQFENPKIDLKKL